MPEEFVANMGEYVIGKTPDILAALALGSCVGVVLYDKERKIAGLAHVMLPKQYEVSKTREGLNQNKFADVVIPLLLSEVKKNGANKIEAKIAGGAHMFQGLSKEVLNIGKKNDEAVREELAKLNISIIASETGGRLGRTIKFNMETSRLMIRTKEGIKEI